MHFFLIFLPPLNWTLVDNSIGRSSSELTISTSRICTRWSHTKGEIKSVLLFKTVVCNFFTKKRKNWKTENNPKNKKCFFSHQNTHSSKRKYLSIKNPWLFKILTLTFVLYFFLISKVIIFCEWLRQRSKNVYHNVLDIKVTVEHCFMQIEKKSKWPLRFKTLWYTFLLLWII